MCGCDGRAVTVPVAGAAGRDLRKARQCNGAPPRHAILRAPPAGGILSAPPARATQAPRRSPARLPRMDSESSVPPASTPFSVPPSPFAREAAFALAAAASAAELITARAGTGDVREKQRADLVTDVDEAAERLILDRVRDHFP